MSSPFSNGKKRKLSSKLPKTSTIQQPKAGTKSTELEQSLAQGSDILTDGHEPVEEPATIVGEASGASNEGQQNLNIKMNAEDLTKVLTDHTKDLSTHCDKQLSALTKAVETTRLTPTFPSGNSVPLPKFSGDRVLGQLLIEQLAFINLVRIARWRSCPFISLGMRVSGITPRQAYQEKISTRWPRR